MYPVQDSGYMSKPHYQTYAVEEYIFREEPFYLPIGREIEIFEAAYANHLPVLLKGPTGCGKTRFIEHMSYRLGRTAGRR